MLKKQHLILFNELIIIKFAVFYSGISSISIGETPVYGKMCFANLASFEVPAPARILLESSLLIFHMNTVHVLVKK